MHRIELTWISLVWRWDWTGLEWLEKVWNGLGLGLDWIGYGTGAANHGRRALIARYYGNDKSKSGSQRMSEDTEAYA